MCLIMPHSSVESGRAILMVSKTDSQSCVLSEEVLRKAQTAPIVKNDRLRTCDGDVAGRGSRAFAGSESIG